MLAHPVNLGREPLASPARSRGRISYHDRYKLRYLMNSTVIGTIELADRPVDALASASRPTRRSSDRFAVATPVGNDETIEADLAQIRRQLLIELNEFMEAVAASQTA